MLSLPSLTNICGDAVILIMAIVSATDLCCFVVISGNKQETLANLIILGLKSKMAMLTCWLILHQQNKEEEEEEEEAINLAQLSGTTILFPLHGLLVRRHCPSGSLFLFFFFSSPTTHPKGKDAMACWGGGYHVHKSTATWEKWNMQAWDDHSCMPHDKSWQKLGCKNPIIKLAGIGYL